MLPGPRFNRIFELLEGIELVLRGRWHRRIVFIVKLAGKLAWADAANECHCSLYLSAAVRTDYMYCVR